MAVYKAATSYKNPKRPDLRGFGYLAILKKLREQDPDLADEIERRGDQIFDSYDETERYRRRDSAGNKEPLTAIARAQEQAVKEYVERFPDIASFLQPETFREKDQKFGTTSEVADRELGMVKDTFGPSKRDLDPPNSSDMIDFRKERLLKLFPDANLQKTPTNKTNRELAEDQAVSAIEIYEDEQKRKSIEEQLNSLESAITPVFSSTSSMSGNKAVASVEEDEDTAIIDEEDEEYYYDVAGPRKTFKEQTLSPDKGIGDESKSAPVKDENVDNIIVASDPTEESIVIEEDEEEVTDEDVDDIVSELNTIERGRASDADTSASEPPTGMLATLSEYAPSILQAIGLGGASYFDNKAIGEANKRNRRSQARSNLINALSRGSGARASVSEPKTGVGSALFKSLAGLGKGVEARREAQETNEYRRKQQELAERRLGRDEARAERSEKAKQEVNKLKQDKEVFDILLSSLTSRADKQQVTSKTIDELIRNDPSFAENFNSMSPKYQTLLRTLAGGLTYEYEKGDAGQLSGLVSLLEDNWNAITKPSSILTGAAFSFLDFIGGDEKRALSRLMPESSAYASLAKGFTVNIAKAFNGGRPSDADAKAVSFLIPIVGEGEEAVAYKFRNLRKLADLALEAEGKLPRTPDGEKGFIEKHQGEIFKVENGKVVVDEDGFRNVIARYGTNLSNEKPLDSKSSTNNNVNSDTSWADGFVPKEE